MTHSRRRFAGSEKSAAAALAALLFALGVFTLILINRSPNILRPVSMSLRTGFGIVIPAAAVVLWAAFRVRGLAGELLACTLTLALFGLGLAGLWASGQTQTTVLSGLIPLYDASDYYTDALRVLDGQDFSAVSARRPLFPGFLAVLLAVTGRDLMITLGILTAVTAICIYYAAKEILRTHGAAAAAIVVIILFAFYRAHSGVAMTEHLGVALGAAGFGQLWRGAADRKAHRVLWGLLLTTLALNARAGTFFMLPMMAFWAGWLFRRPQRRFSRDMLAASLACISAGFVVGLMLTRLLAGPAGIPFGNFAYSLYGLASGGESWAQVFQEHPELAGLPEADQIRNIYRLALERIRDQPMQLARGALFNWRMLFSDSWYSAYSYVGGEDWRVGRVAQFGLYSLCVLGVLAWIGRPSDPLLSLTIAAAIGILLSVPFVPPGDAYRMRPYAASIIVFGALPAQGLTYLLVRIRKRLNGAGLGTFDSTDLASASSLLLVIAISLGPIVIKARGTPTALRGSACNQSQDSIVIRLDPGTRINVRERRLAFLDWAPDFHVGTFQRSSHGLADTSFIRWTSEIQAPISIVHTLDYRTGGAVFIAVDPNLLLDDGSLVEMCGRQESERTPNMPNIFYAGQVLLAPP